MAGDETRKEPIKVTDRRSFTADGERRSQDPAPPPDPEESPSAETVRGEGFSIRRDLSEASAPAGTPPPVSFGSLVISLATTAMIHLGVIKNPGTAQTEVNIEAAREVIDILDVLRDKTRGNLDAEESALIEDTLYDLRLTFSRVAGQG